MESPWSTAHVLMWSVVASPCVVVVGTAAATDVLHVSWWDVSCLAQCKATMTTGSPNASLFSMMLRVTTRSNTVIQCSRVHKLSQINTYGDENYYSHFPCPVMWMNIGA